MQNHNPTLGIPSVPNVKISTCKDNKIFGVWGAWGEIGKFGKQLFSSSPCTSCPPCTLYPVPLVPNLF